MKKVLFATSALVACAGMAAADVTLSGSGRFGIVYDDGDRNGVNAPATWTTTRIEKRMTINIDGSGSTDGGLEFGGRIRLRSDENEAGGGAVSGANVWMGNDMFRITVGNTDGALVNQLPFFAGSVGLTGLRWENVAFNMGNQRFYLDTFSSRGNATATDVVRLDFNVGGFGVSLSTNNSSDHTTGGTPGSEDAIALSYNFGDWTVSAGYASNVLGAGPGVVENDFFSVGVTGSIGDFGVGLVYADLEDLASKVVLSGSYSFGDTTVTAFVGNIDEDTPGSVGIGATGEETVYGIGFTHSLGGATLAGGINSDARDSIQADLGVRFTF